MRYQDAVMLRVGDEIKIKTTGAITKVVSITIEPRLVRLYCEDWTTYFHTEVQQIMRRTVYES